ncbi:hypothetical protein CN916_32080 [Bacillus thuringiensis]|nr:hypothetical protein [Bacillus thuringiensis]PDY39511.1 hypothetical protein COM85_03000 [Bacillus thuringiensis]PFE39385.1 hypothetical protein CN312_22850 [Bacillus thuringiensis]PFT88321.1 hypothetical protein COK78_31385 [Bacillus thuringiensis]PGL13332.1 hypothetical protein CN916_32080 [Bacillus thuringiensis]
MNKMENRQPKIKYNSNIKKYKKQRIYVEFAVTKVENYIILPFLRRYIFQLEILFLLKGYHNNLLESFEEGCF